MSNTDKRVRAEAWNEAQLRGKALGRIFQALEVLGVTSMELKDVTLEDGKKEHWVLNRKGPGEWDIQK